jgi:ribose transport system ATP-binding protein
VRGVSKQFGGVRALDTVDLTVLPGEVHGLLGENGSGKSTLIKVLSGFHAPDGGTLEIHGHPVDLPLAPGEFRGLGLSFVHQDLGLVQTLSVVENLRVGMLARSRRQLHISWGAERRRAREVLAGYGVSLDPGAIVGELRPVERALLAIVRALEEMREERTAPGLLVLDEPTVFLPRADVDHLFALVREVAAGGGSVLFVSHDLDEVQEITDRATVLRDGRVVGTVVTREVDEGQLVEMIIGRRLATYAAQHHDLTALPAAITVQGLRGASVDNVAMELHSGEVLGITGLAGSGFESVPYLLYGAWPALGRLTIDGRTHELGSLAPDTALAAGMALIPADRRSDGAVGSLTITDNVSLPRLPDYFLGARLRRKTMQRTTGRLLDEYDVRPAEPGYDYGSLSGGNQQKVLMAKWLQGEPRFLLLHEPTQGVDVGARQQIFETVRAAAARGACVLVASSDYEQLATICDRVLVFARGHVARELRGDDVTKERITEQCYASAAVESVTG